jgi:hypothetical protein
MQEEERFSALENCAEPSRSAWKLTVTSQIWTGKKLISIKISERFPGFLVSHPWGFFCRSPAGFAEVGRFVEWSATCSSLLPFANLVGSHFFLAKRDATNLSLPSLASCQLVDYGFEIARKQRAPVLPRLPGFQNHRPVPIRMPTFGRSLLRPKLGLKMTTNNLESKLVDALMDPQTTVVPLSNCWPDII